MICRVLYNSRTGVWFIISENLNKIKNCTKLSREVGVRNCRKKLILWCSSEMQIIVVLYWKMSDFKRVGF